jgi:hypothetical protein
MQTFVPHGPNFHDNARSLDYRRLGKQRVETKQILMALRGESKGWTNHPATKMWRGYEPALALYGAIMCKEWKRRGYVDNLRSYFDALLSEYLSDTGVLLVMPPWLYDSNVVQSHRSNLIRKDEDFYGPQWPTVPSDLPYIWPVQEVAA